MSRLKEHGTISSRRRYAVTATSLPIAAGMAAAPAIQREWSERCGGSHQHLLLLSGEGSQWRAINIGNHLFYRVGDAVRVGRRYHVGAIERALAADLLGGQVYALIHYSDIRWAIEPQVAKVDSCLVWPRIRLHCRREQRCSDQKG
jgi:hypothetical protein